MTIIISSALILISNTQMHELIEIIFQIFHKEDRGISYIKELYYCCTISGVITFGMALYSTLSLKFSYKLVIVQFVLIFFMQIGAMFIGEKVPIVVIYVYDGLFKGGMYVILYEVTAELGYPYGESLSLGMLTFF